MIGNGVPSVPPISALELIETDVLIDELLRRFDHALFCGMKLINADEHYERFQKVGNSRTVQGLACSVIARLERDLRNRTSPCTPDDPYSSHGGDYEQGL